MNQPASRTKRPNHRRAGGNKGPPNTPKKLSHALSWALRHSAQEIGLHISPAGWVPVHEIIESRHPRLKGCTLEAIEEVVSTSDKKRFALSLRPLSEFAVHELQMAGETNEVMCIRANQGHSMGSIDPNLLLRKLSPNDVSALPCIVHGTYTDAWDSISTQGLKTMSRTHIHFARGLPEDEKVISGMRKSANVHIYLDSEKCIRDDIQFFESENGVILTDGVDGTLPPRYFLKVTGPNGENLLCKDQKECCE